MDNIFICDIDGVLSDTHTAWLTLYSQESGHHLTPEMITDWNIDNFVLPEWKEKFWEIFERQYLYDLVLPIPGALEGIKELQAKNWRVLFVTSPSDNENPMRRFTWLKKWGFTNNLRNFIVARDKELISGKVIIDDNPSTIYSCHPSKVGILFRRPWNYSSDCFIRAENWKQVVAIVEDTELIENHKVDTYKTIKKWKELGLIQDRLKEDDEIWMGNTSIPVRLDPNLPENQINLEAKSYYNEEKIYREQFDEFLRKLSGK